MLVHVLAGAELSHGRWELPPVDPWRCRPSFLWSFSLPRAYQGRCLRRLTLWRALWLPAPVLLTWLVCDLPFALHCCLIGTAAVGLLV